MREHICTSKPQTRTKTKKATLEHYAHTGTDLFPFAVWTLVKFTIKITQSRLWSASGEAMSGVARAINETQRVFGRVFVLYLHVRA